MGGDEKGKGPGILSKILSVKGGGEIREPGTIRMAAREEKGLELYQENGWRCGGEGERKEGPVTATKRMRLWGQVRKSVLSIHVHHGTLHNSFVTGN